jgi:hypothetical protein
MGIEGSQAQARHIKTRLSPHGKIRDGGWARPENTGKS